MDGTRWTNKEKKGDSWFPTDSQRRIRETLNESQGMEEAFPFSSEGMWENRSQRKGYARGIRYRRKKKGEGKKKKSLGSFPRKKKWVAVLFSIL